VLCFTMFIPGKDVCHACHARGALTLARKMCSAFAFH
jgi:hypothetical protein